VLFGASRIAQLEQNHAALALVAERGGAVREALAGLQADVVVRDDGAW